MHHAIELMRGCSSLNVTEAFNDAHSAPSHIVNVNESTFDHLNHIKVYTTQISGLRGAQEHP